MGNFEEAVMDEYDTRDFGKEAVGGFKTIKELKEYIEGHTYSAFAEERLQALKDVLKLIDELYEEPYVRELQELKARIEG